MIEDSDDRAREIFRRIAELAVAASIKSPETLTQSEQAAIALVAGCDFEISSTGFKITEPFTITRVNGRITIYRHAKKQGKSL